MGLPNHAKKKKSQIINDRRTVSARCGQGSRLNACFICVKSTPITMFGSSSGKKSSSPAPDSDSDREESLFPRKSWGVVIITGMMWILTGMVFCIAMATLEFALKEGVRSPVAGANLLGWVGAYTAYGFSIVFGWSAWLIAILMIWFGIYQVLHRGNLPPRMMWWGAVMVVVSSGFLAVQHAIGVDWANDAGVLSVGGAVGYFLGVKLAQPALTVLGSIVLFASIYLLSLVYVAGVYPVPFTKAAWWEYREWRKRRAENQAWSPDDALKEKPVDFIESQEQKLKAREALEDIRSNVRSRQKEDEEKASRPIDFSPSAMREIRPDPEPEPVRRSPRSKPVVIEAPLPSEEEAALDSLGEDDDVDIYEEKRESYQLPGLDLINYIEPDDDHNEKEEQEMRETQLKIVETLQSFGIEVTPGNITRGPTITRYEIYPSRGLRVNRITALEADISRATQAERINILAPIPGRDTVGIEIVNNRKSSVSMRELLESKEFSEKKKRIPLALGKDVYGNVVIGDLTAMPHLLVAGTTGAGKSVFIGGIISSILYKFRPDELRLILVDPKVVEMQMYAKLPHLMVPVVTDPKKVLGALRWAVNEMEHRYRVFAKMGVRSFESFNERPKEAKQEPLPYDMEPESASPSEEELPIDEEFIEDLAASIEGHGYEPAPRNDRGGTNSSYYVDDEDEDEDDEIPDKFPYLVIIIDELADLMMTAPKEIEDYICRLTQKARAAGIHLILATQSPRSNVVTGLIKANIPTRVALRVSSPLDSRIILDRNGAEKLVGKGDFLYLPPGSSKLDRAQGAYLSDPELDRIVSHCASQEQQKFEPVVQEHIESESLDGGGDENELKPGDEEALQRAIEVFRMEQKASTSLLQRRLNFGYGKAARIVDILEKRGLIAPSDGSGKGRDVYIK